MPERDEMFSQGPALPWKQDVEKSYLSMRRKQGGTRCIMIDVQGPEKCFSAKYYQANALPWTPIKNISFVQSAKHPLYQLQSCQRQMRYADVEGSVARLLQKLISNL